jgi:hypothetical protein
MKALITFIFFISCSFSTFSQKSIRQVMVNEEGYNFEINYLPINQEIKSSEIFVQIEPISADILDQELYNFSVLDGKFSKIDLKKSRTEYFNSSKLKAGKSNKKFLEDGVERLFDELLVSQEEYTELLALVTSYYDDKEKKNETQNKTHDSNPYLIDDKYLSVFRIVFENPTANNLTFIPKIYIQNGDMIYTPYKTSKLEELLSQSGNLTMHKSLNLDRLNITDTLYIPAGTKITKYFSVPPIDYTKSGLKIYINDFETPLVWNITTEMNIINEKHLFYSFGIEVIGNGSVTVYTPFILMTKSGNPDHFIQGSDLFIDQDKLNEEFELLVIHRDGAKFYYGRKLGRGIDLIDLGREKVKDFSIVLESIEL